MKKASTSFNPTKKVSVYGFTIDIPESSSHVAVDKCGQLYAYGSKPYLPEKDQMARWKAIGAFTPICEVEFEEGEYWYDTLVRV